jgi:transposase
MAITEKEIDKVKRKYDAIAFCLNEKGKRLWSAVEARSYGRGGVKLMCKATKLSTATLYRGFQDLDNKNLDTSRVRVIGGGRKKATKKQSGLLEALDALVDPTAIGNPENPLKWTSKSVRKLAEELNVKGYQVCYKTVSTLLKELGYSLQANKKTLEKNQHIDRDKQFGYINEKSLQMQKCNCPVVSVDTKKKENIGNYKNNGQEFAKKATPVKVNGHDFPDKKLGKVVPYGIYDIGKNKGWVSVGISSDTAEFAVNAVRTWWYSYGKVEYSNAGSLMITADCGGSNGYKNRLWKVELQKLANEINLSIHICHFPPGTSKWNKIEHRLFSYISKNWRGKPLLTKEIVVNLIANTKTKKGLTVAAVLDENKYEPGRKITDKELDLVNIIGDNFHPEWNYCILQNQ